MQKYVLVTFLQPIADGTEFMVGHWPLHTTLVSNFAVDLQQSQLVDSLAKLFESQAPIKTTALEDAYFGPEGQVHVTLLELTPDLKALHDKAVQLIANAGAAFDEPQYLNAGFKPHVTVQTDGRVVQGESVTISAASLVDMFPNADIRGRRVMQTFTFKG